LSISKEKEQQQRGGKELDKKDTSGKGNQKIGGGLSYRLPFLTSGEGADIDSRNFASEGDGGGDGKKKTAIN